MLYKRVQRAHTVEGSEHTRGYQETLYGRGNVLRNTAFQQEETG